LTLLVFFDILIYSQGVFSVVFSKIRKKTAIGGLFAYHKSVDTVWPETAESKKQVSGPGELSFKAWRLHPGVYHQPEKAELRHAQGGPRAPDKRD
jgi:hypothetical protein